MELSPAPDASPTAVRLPLLLTGKPWNTGSDIRAAQREELLVRINAVLATGRESPGSQDVVGVADE
jgi:hypothetical protein